MIQPVPNDDEFEEYDAASESPPDRGEPTMEVQHLHRHFGKLKAVNNVSFTGYKGQVIGFIGPNGAGKTTAMRILSTLDTPTAGDCYVCGYSVVDDPDKVRRLLGFMPDAFGKYPNMNVEEYLDFFARAYGFQGDRRRAAVRRVMEFTELDRILDKPIASLSKGMSQRLGLGRTLIHDPQVLILDEPAAGLDPRARVELRELIKLLATELDKTVLISSHILTELGEICDSAVIIEAGRILVSGTVEEIAKAQRESIGRQNTISIVVRVLKDAERLEKWLLEQEHVETVGSHTDQMVGFEFEGTDEQRVGLLKQAIADGFEVAEFHSKSESLEDAFMNITRGIMQ